MTASLNPALDELAHALGYRSAIDFTRIQLENMAVQKLAYFKSRVELYEQKYGMSYQEFMNRVVNQHDTDLNRFGIFEKEDDSFDWDDSLHSVQFYQQQLATLANGGTA
ncbi:hypothetical protein [Spirosoma gilvum]